MLIFILKQKMVSDLAFLRFRIYENHIYIYEKGVYA